MLDRKGQTALEYLMIIVVAVITIIVVYNWAISTEGTLEETGSKGVSKISRESMCADDSDCVPGECQENPRCENNFCQFDKITVCADADGCCPVGCNANNDKECTPRCGNDVMEPGESCDGSDDDNCPDQCVDCDCPGAGGCNGVWEPEDPAANVECDGDPSIPSDVSREDARCGTLVCDFGSCTCVLPPGCNGVWEAGTDECDGGSDSEADSHCSDGQYCDADCRCIDACDGVWDDFDTRADIQCDGADQVEANGHCTVAGQVCDTTTCTCVAGGGGCDGVWDPVNDPLAGFQCDGSNDPCLDGQLCGSDCMCGPMISIIPSSQDIGMGGTVTITVYIENAYFEGTTGCGYQMSIEYDGSVLGDSRADVSSQPVASNAGSFFEGNWFPPVLKANLLDGAGEMKPPGPGVSGSGNLFSVTFTAIGTGTSQITLTDISLWSIAPDMIRQFGEEGSATITVHA